MGKSKKRKAQEKAERNEEAAKRDADKYRSQYMALDISNPYLNQTNFMSGLKNQFAGLDNVYSGLENQYTGLSNVYSGLENTAEDLTVNQQQAQFEAQQMQQSQANILGGLRGAAGGSGIAALAQSLSQQGQIGAQRASASIGQQESRNQALAAQQAAQLQSQEAGYAGQLQQMRAGEASRLQSQEATYAGQLQQMQAGEAAQLQMAEANMAQQLQSQEIMGEIRREDTERARIENMLGMSLSQQAGYAQAAQNWSSQRGQGWQVAGQVVGAKAAMMCVPKGVFIDSVDKAIAIENIKPGDIVIGYSGEPVKVLQKHEYLEDPSQKRFYKVEFNNGSIVDTCDIHKIKGVPSKDITENVKSKEVYGGVEFSYDLLTEDLGYRINNTPVNSMIEEMAIRIAKLNNK
tara:strand:+ start:1423 stop:2637 length:1215 start_codon:yes stop_codon:yes gene_type:complete